MGNDQLGLFTPPSESWQKWPLVFFKHVYLAILGSKMPFLGMMSDFVTRHQKALENRWVPPSNDLGSKGYFQSPGICFLVQGLVVLNIFDFHTYLGKMHEDALVDWYFLRWVEPPATLAHQKATLCRTSRALPADGMALPWNLWLQIFGSLEKILFFFLVCQVEVDLNIFDDLKQEMVWISSWNPISGFKLVTQILSLMRFYWFNNKGMVNN